MFFNNPRKRTTNRQFNYNPRYYDPSKDDDLKKRMRLGAHSRRRRRSGLANVVVFIVILVAIVFFMNVLTDYA